MPYNPCILQCITISSSDLRVHVGLHQDVLTRTVLEVVVNKEISCSLIKLLPNCAIFSTE